MQVRHFIFMLSCALGLHWCAAMTWEEKNAVERSRIMNEKTKQLFAKMHAIDNVTIPELLKLIADPEIAVNAQDAKKRVLLHLATRDDLSRDLIPALLRRGALPNMQDSDGETPLLWLAKYSDSVPHNRELIELLIKHGARLDMKKAGTADQLPLVKIVRRGEISPNIRLRAINKWLKKRFHLEKLKPLTEGPLMDALPSIPTPLRGLIMDYYLDLEDVDAIAGENKAQGDAKEAAAQQQQEEKKVAVQQRVEQQAALTEGAQQPVKSVRVKHELALLQHQLLALASARA